MTEHPLNPGGRTYAIDGCSCDAYYYSPHQDTGCRLNPRRVADELARSAGCETVRVNGRWPLWLPAHRAARPEWPWWEAARLAAMWTVIGSGSVVWDIGAEEGDFPALWASWGADVFLAEPNPRVWPNIKLVWEANALRDPIGTWSGFVGDLTHVPDDAQWPYLLGWPDSAAGEVIGDHGFCQLGERPDLPSTTVDRLVESGIAPPTVLTMDVEGSEWHVLKGARETLREHRPDVFVSVHPEFMEHHYGYDHGVERIRGWMNDVAGYPFDRHTFLAIDHEHHWWFRP